MLRHQAKQPKKATTTTTTTTTRGKKPQIHTIAQRGPKAVKKQKKKKALFKPLKEELLLGNVKKVEEVYTHDPTPAHKATPATPNHMPAQHPGYTFRNRLNEFTVDSLSPTQKKFCELPDGSGSRYSMISYQRTKPFVVKGILREKGKQPSNHLRDEGMIPCSLTNVLNGKEQQILFAVDPISLEKYKTAKYAWSIEWHIDIEGFQENFRGYLRDWQIDPVTRKTGSLRFIGNTSHHPIHVHLPLEFEGHEDGNASKKGAMMLTPHTNIQGLFHPGPARRLGIGNAPIESIQITHDREPHHTVRAGDIALPTWFTIPDQKTWRKHVLMTFTKDGL